MTNMQLAFSQLIEDQRHHRADEAIQSDKNTVSRETNALNKYLGELNAETKRQEILTNAEVQKLKIATDKAIADAKQNLSEREFEATKKKIDAEISKLEANTKESLAQTERTKRLTPVEAEKLQAEANYRNSKALGSISGIIGSTVGKALAISDSPAGQAIQKGKVQLAIKGAKALNTLGKTVATGIKSAAKDYVERKVEHYTNPESNNRR